MITARGEASNAVGGGRVSTDTALHGSYILESPWMPHVPDCEKRAGTVTESMESYLSITKQ
jgi:hypothetical protein